LPPYPGTPAVRRSRGPDQGEQSVSIVQRLHAKALEVVSEPNIRMEPRGILVEVEERLERR
jgi:hypothetical protein